MGHRVMWVKLFDRFGYRLVQAVLEKLPWNGCCCFVVAISIRSPANYNSINFLPHDAIHSR